MFKNNLTVLAMAAVFPALLLGCAQQPKSANSQAAIEQAKTMPSVEAQVKYLVSEANAFINSQKFDEAVNTARYVLGNLDANSTEAKSIIERATAELKKAGEQAMADMKNKLTNIGK